MGLKTIPGSTGAWGFFEANWMMLTLSNTHHDYMFLELGLWMGLRHVVFG